MTIFISDVDINIVHSVWCFSFRDDHLVLSWVRWKSWPCSRQHSRRSTRYLWSVKAGLHWGTWSGADPGFYKGGWIRDAIRFIVLFSLKYSYFLLLTPQKRGVDIHPIHPPCIRPCWCIYFFTDCVSYPLEFHSLCVSVNNRNSFPCFENILVSAKDIVRYWAQLFTNR